MKPLFISGPPRSGFILLAGLLRRNTRFHADMTGRAAPMAQVLLDSVTAANETAVLLEEKRRRAILRVTVNARDAPQSSRDKMFDANRGWRAGLPLLRALYPEGEVICCVRDVAWMMDSFQRLLRRNATEPSRLSGGFPRMRPASQTPPAWSGPPWLIAPGPNIRLRGKRGL